MVKRITIKDIAKLAHVSPTAVSMALNNRPGIGPKTRERIMRIAKEHDYQPNYIAKSLISKRSHSIGLVVTNITDPFYPELARGVEHKAEELGFHLVLSSTDGSLDKEKRSIDMLRAKGVDGIILSTVTRDDPHLQALVDDRFPFVLTNRMSLDPALANKTDYVVLDNYSGGYAAMRHLYRLGHDRIATIAGQMNTSTTIRRLEGAAQALKDHGADQNQRRIIECGFMHDEAFQATRKLLGQQNRPTAFFAHDDNMALGVREAVLNAGLAIPEDIALVGFDDIDMVALKGVELTTISQSSYEMGLMGVKVLNDKIEATAPHMVNQIILQADLVIRRSCGYHLKGYNR